MTVVPASMAWPPTTSAATARRARVGAGGNRRMDSSIAARVHGRAAAQSGWETSKASASAFSRPAIAGLREIRCRVQPRVRAVVSCPARMKVRMLAAISRSVRAAPSASSRAARSALSRSSGVASPVSIRLRRADTRAPTRSSKKRAELALAVRPRRGIQPGALITSSGSMRAPMLR
ncbi:hypothetical protein D3C77_528510 [compost metagenome]